MGNATAAVASGVSVTTSEDLNSWNLTALSSGHIGDRVLVNSFVIASDDRIEFKSGVAATLTFTPSAGGELAAAASITLCFPPNFFALNNGAASLAFSCSATGVEGLVGMESERQNCIVVTLSGAGAISSGQPVIVTLSGLTMGRAAPQNETGLTLSTSQDQVVSQPFAAGNIGARLSLQLFAIHFTDRVAGKLDSVMTLHFRTTVGGAVAAGGTITVKFFAKEFFRTTQTPLFSCSQPFVKGTCSFDVDDEMYSSIVITTAGAPIPANASVAITLSGVTMGDVHDGCEVLVDTSSDHESMPVSSGSIYSKYYVRFLSQN
jgi:hypothetical protein